MSRSGIIFITRNLPPLTGGMERVAWHVIDELHQYEDIRVIGPKGCRQHLAADIPVTELPLRPIALFLILAAITSLWFSFWHRPRLLLAGSGLTAPLAWISALLSGAKCAAYLHGLDIDAPHPVYRAIWRPVFRKCNLVLTNSRFTKTRAQTAGVAAEKIHILHPGVTLPDLSNAARQRREFRKKHGIAPTSPTLLYVGRITARKGLAVFVREIFPYIVASRPDTKLIVVGDEPSQALQHKEGELDRIIQILDTNQQRDHVTLLSQLSDNELDSAYFSADALIFPVQEGKFDHEGFGMVAVEAAAHNLKTIAFCSGGVPDAVAHGISGTLVDPGNHASFAQAVLKQLECTDDHPTNGLNNAHEFAAEFTWTKFGERLRRLLAPDSKGIP